RLLKYPWIRAATGAPATSSDAGVDAIAAEPRAGLRCCIRAAVVRRDNLDVLDLSFTVGTFVFNPHAGKMGGALDNGQVAPCGPFRNVLRGVVAVPLGTAAIAIQLAEK